MTKEELRTAREQEAHRRYMNDQGFDSIESIISHAFDVMEENWTPPVDPLLVEALEFCAQAAEQTGAYNFAASYRAGKFSGSHTVQAVLLALKSREVK